MSTRKTKKCWSWVTLVYNNNKTGYCQKCYRKNQEDQIISNWLLTGDSGHKAISTIKGPIRRYIYKDQENTCAICNMSNQWNNKEIKFSVDHIDGKADNNWRNNLRLICPNCDSQLDTYKSKNKNSARSYR